MAMPLRSEDPNPRDVQFRDFGVLNDGSQSKRALATSVAANLLILTLAIIIGSAVKHIVAPKEKKDVTFVEEPVKPPPPPPKLPPPPKIKVPPPPVVEPPKIKLPDPVKLPDPPKIPEVKMPTPAPIKLAPAPPKAITPPPAPVHIANLNPQAASIKNNDAHPSAVRLGSPDNPLKSMSGPAVSNVNFGNAGMRGMPSSNTGSGPRATAVSMGNGAAGSQNLNGRGNGPTVVTGFNKGIPGGTGRPGGTAAQAVNIASMGQPAAERRPVQTEHALATPPQVTYKPQPVYTEDAKAAHVEGAVSLRIRVSASGSVEVLGVTRSLGHGLDQAAMTVARGMRFNPAKDSSGNPVNWEGVVNVNFQMS